MFVTFFHELKSRQGAGHAEGIPDADGGAAAPISPSSSVEDFYYLSRAALVKDERHLDKFDQVFGHVFKGLELMSEAVEGRDPRGVAAPRLAALPLRGGQEEDRGARRLGQDHGGAEEAPRRAEGPPPGRLEVDRHRRHLALRRLRLQPGRRAHRPEGATAISARSRSGTSASSRTSTTTVELGTRNIKVALRRLRKLRARRARRRSSTSTAPSRAPRTRATSTSTCGPSGATR